MVSNLKVFQLATEAVQFLQATHPYLNPDCSNLHRKRSRHVAGQKQTEIDIDCNNGRSTGKGCNKNSWSLHVRCAHPRGELQEDEDLETSGVGLSVFPIDSCSTSGAWCILSWAAGQLHSTHIALLSGC